MLDLKMWKITFCANAERESEAKLSKLFICLEKILLGIITPSSRNQVRCRTRNQSGVFKTCLLKKKKKNILMMKHGGGAVMVWGFLRIIAVRNLALKRVLDSIGGFKLGGFLKDFNSPGIFWKSSPTSVLKAEAATL